MIKLHDVQNLRPFRSGGFALVRRGELADGRKVVVRSLQKELRFKFTMRQAFVRGIRIRRLLKPHKYIVGSLGGGGGLNPYEILDFIDGDTLVEWRTEMRGSHYQHGLNLMIQTAEAVEHVHSCGYLHLDIKPANFIISMDDMKITTHCTDFDLALPIREKPYHDKSMRLGTFSYMAPELLADGLIDIRTDTFAWGVLIYYLFSNRMPYPADNASESRRVKQDRNFTPTPLHQLCQWVPPGASELIMQCLHPDPNKRTAYMGAIIRDLCKLR
jgi:serine/threonine protein kinase